jgi:molybdopterin synthase sulfur carrier subunit
MKINVLFFGSLSDIIGKQRLEYENITDINELKTKINSEYHNFNKIKYLISVNKNLIKSNIDLNNNDEVAFLPPFAGG